MILRVSLLVLGALLFVFLGWGAVQAWITVFAEGAGTAVDTSTRSGRSGEAPAIVGALVFTFFALFAGAAAVVGGMGIARARRDRPRP